MNILLRNLILITLVAGLFLPWYLLLPAEIQPLLLVTMSLKIFFTIVVLNFLWVIISKYRKYPSTAIIYLALAAGLYLFSYIVEFIAIYFINVGSQTVAEYLYVTGQMTSIISPVSVILFISVYQSNRINPVHLLPTTFAAGMLLQAATNGESIRFESFARDGQTLHYVNYEQLAAWYYIGFMTSFLYILAYFIYASYKLREKSFEEEIRKQQKLFVGGIIFSVGVTPFLFLYINQLSDPFTVFILNFSVANSFTIVSILFAIYPYINNEHPGYLQPQPLEHLIVVQKNGVLLLSMPFGEEKIDDVLFSGAVSAVSSIMKEATGSMSDIRKLEFDDKTLLTRFKDDLGFVLIVEYETSALTTYINQYSEEFQQEFSEDIREAIRQSMMLKDDKVINYTRKIFGLPEIDM